MKAPRQDIYNAVIHRMAQESLNAKHEAFALAHADDTEQELLFYIRSCAYRLGHSPHQKEIIGWPMITDRFGTWVNALRAARLQLPWTPNTPSQFAIMQDEIETQKQIYRKKKVQKKLRAQKRLAEQKRRKKENTPLSKKKWTTVPATENRAT